MACLADIFKDLLVFSKDLWLVRGVVATGTQTRGVVTNDVRTEVSGCVFTMGWWWKRSVTAIGAVVAWMVTCNLR